MKAILVLAAALALLTPRQTPRASATGPPGRSDERRQATTASIPRMTSPAAQLGHARRLKRQMLEKRGEEVVLWRELTLEAYRAVRVFHPDARTHCVEAAFRAGEILRAAGDESGALAEFRWCAQHAQDTEFRARAQLEVGHLHRRAQRWRAALDLYLDVAVDPTADEIRREDAWLWVGSAWKALGRVEDARLAWRRVADRGTDALARVQAFDELGLLLLAEDDVEGAAGVLDQCLRALSARALEETEAGERVRNALQRMRVVEELQRAIARRDAVRVRKEPGESLDK